MPILNADVLSAVGTYQPYVEAVAMAQLQGDTDFLLNLYVADAPLTARLLHNLADRTRQLLHEYTDNRTAELRQRCPECTAELHQLKANNRAALTLLNSNENTRHMGPWLLFRQGLQKRKLVLTGSRVRARMRRVMDWTMALVVRLPEVLDLLNSVAVLFLAVHVLCAHHCLSMLWRQIPTGRLLRRVLGLPASVQEFVIECCMSVGDARRQAAAAALAAAAVPLGALVSRGGVGHSPQARAAGRSPGQHQAAARSSQAAQAIAGARQQHGSARGRPGSRRRQQRQQSGSSRVHGGRQIVLEHEGGDSAPPAAASTSRHMRDGPGSVEIDAAARSQHHQALSMVVLLVERITAWWAARLLKMVL